MALVGSPGEGIAQSRGSFLRWAPPVRSANRVVNQNKALVDGRAFDLVNNDAIIQSGVNYHKDAIVGARYALNSQPAGSILGGAHDDVWEEEFAAEVETKFMLAADSVSYPFDYQKMRTFTEVVRLAVGIHIYAGEYLQSHEWDKKDKLRPFKTCVLPIAPERLSSPNGQMDTFNMRRGVERDYRGAPIAYHIREAAPDDISDINRFTWRRVSAAKPWGRTLVLHVLNHTLPDQNRAISTLAAGLEEVQMLRKFRRTVLQNVLVASTYAATIESELPSEVAFSQLGVSGVDIQEAISKYGLGFLNSIADYLGDSNTLEIDGVRIPHLFPGTKLKLQPATGGDGALGSEFEASMVRYMAAMLDVSYEELSRDMRGANYTTMRAAMGLTDRALKVRKTMVADKVATTIYRLWLEEMILTGEITALPRRRADLYEGLNFDAYSSCSWIGASRGQIDALKETEAAVLRVASNLSTLEAEAAAMGYDYRRVLKQRGREKKELLAEGLDDVKAPAPSDPNTPAGQGADQPGDKTPAKDKKNPAKKDTTK